MAQTRSSEQDLCHAHHLGRALH